MGVTRLGAALWIACLQYFVAEAIAIAAWRIPYSLSQNFISDLGALTCTHTICSPLHALMNASFLLQGVLILSGTILNLRQFPATWPCRLAMILIAASAFGVFGVGLAPEDYNPFWHHLAAAENFLCCNLGMVLLGVALLRSPPPRPLALISLTLGALGLIGLILLAANTPLPVGTVERITAYPFVLWLAATGIILWQAPKPARLRQP